MLRIILRAFLDVIIMGKGERDLIPPPTPEDRTP